MIVQLKRAGAVLFVMFSLQMIAGNAGHGESSGPFSSPKNSGDGKSQSKNDEDSSGSLYQMAPSEFFKKENVEEKIDFQHINHSLLSAAIFHETNEKRKKHGKEQLRHLPRLDEASRLHARDMADHEYVAHINPREQKLQTPRERIGEVGLKDIRFLAENVASNFGIQYEPGKTLYPKEKDGETEYSYQQGGKPIENHTYRSFSENLVEDWMNSPGHRKNILSKKPKFLGAGCSMGEGDKGPVKFYCVQLFFDRLGK